MNFEKGLKVQSVADYDAIWFAYEPPYVNYFTSPFSDQHVKI